ncbi:MAG TPA: DUF2442 domain-containing protein [Gammaproteobacteria bacterium]|nr:DUF2442 domain-containing protein [Gammaproteobacteria bacterium]
MNPSVVSVEPRNDYKLIITFDNGEKRVFDATPFLDKGIFIELKDINYFRKVKVAFGSVEWPHEQDFSKDTLYMLSDIAA